ncbi:MAG: acyl-CoA thioesterase [Pseudomonadales bacterium]
MSEPLAKQLLSELSLEQLDLDIFRARSDTQLGDRLFGGLVLAQALSALQSTVELDRPCLSLHGYFLRPGRVNQPIIFHVDRIRDGKSFTTRRVKGVQQGEAIFSMDASFHVSEPGLHHQMPMAEFPQPEDLEEDRVVASRMPNLGERAVWMTRERPFELRSVYPIDQAPAGRDHQAVWVKFLSRVMREQDHQLLLAYASDMGLVSTASLPHRETIQRDVLQMASLDHALWFHERFDISDWLLYYKESPVSEGSRGMNRGLFYTRDGRLVASTMQEGLMRVIRRAS